MAGEISATVPARPEFVHVFRTVVASVAARLDLPYDQVDELRILVDEACSLLLGLPGTAGSLSLRVVPGAEGVEITVCSDVEAGTWPRTEEQDGLTWQVISGLSDRARFERWDGRPAVWLTKGASAVGGPA
jgi:serine/threonine-protein kinase RsbW